MKCQILFSGKNKKNNIILSSAENAQRVVKVNKFSGIYTYNLLQAKISAQPISNIFFPKKQDLSFYFVSYERNQNQIMSLLSQKG